MPALPRHFRIAFVSIIVIAVLAIAGWGVYKLFDPSTFPTRSIKIRGEYPHVNKVAIEKSIAPLVRESFFDIDIGAIKEQLLHLPWVENVTVRRVWPGVLIITIQEYKPFVIWNKDKLMSEQGVIFAPVTDEFINTLAQLSGPRDEQLDIIQQYKKFTEILASRDLHIKQLQLTSDNLWVLRTTDGTVIMVGEKDAPERLARFVDALPKMAATNASPPKYVDLRYNDGFAVKW